MRDRLTERVGDGIRYDNGKYIVTCYPKNDNLTPVDKLAAKLCDFEDKIENGDVIVPPCKVGQTVWVLNQLKGLVFENTVVCIKIFSQNRYKNTLTLEYRNKLGETSNRKFTWAQVGKQVFLSREEAEKALAERSGE